MASNPNILRVYRQVDEIDRHEGMLAYPRYQASLQVYADKYGVPLSGVVGACCSLSPNNDYMGNLRSLVTLLEGQRLGCTVEDCTVSTYKACRGRAWRFLHGEDFFTVTKGKKTRAFYESIMDPSAPHPVCIDGHMVCVSIGKRMTMKEVVRSKFKYDVVADEFREVAREVGLIPNQLQAMLWFTWKRINNVIYTPQLNAFQMGNQWGTRIDPLTVHAFPIGQVAQ